MSVSKLVGKLTAAKRIARLEKEVAQLRQNNLQLEKRIESLEYQLGHVIRPLPPNIIPTTEPYGAAKPMFPLPEIQCMNPNLS